MLSIVIPFYNDEGCAKPFVTELKKELKGINYELILVDDCSTDNTAQELTELKSKNVKIIFNKKNLDYGGAIMAGLNYAKGDVLGFTCGDGEITAKAVVEVYKKIGNKDIIKAVRQNRQDGLSRKIISSIFNIWSKLRFNLNIKDINGYPVYFKKEIYQELKDLRTDWLFNTDLLRKISAKGYKIHGTEITHEKRFKGKSKMIPSRIIKMIIKYLTYK